MSSLKPLFPFAWPRRGSPARLPALLVPLLGVLAAVQLVLPQGDAPVSSPAVARLALPPLPQPPAQVALPPVLAQRALFASGSAANGAGGAQPAPADPLGGIRIAGTIRDGRALRAVIQWPGGRVSYAGVGSHLGDWTITALKPASARLSGPAGSLDVTYGSQPTTLSIPSEDQQ